jgi:predicted transcriptional regulator
MAIKRKTSLALAESNIGSVDLPAATNVTFQSEKDFFAGAARRVREFKEGRRPRAVARVSFESVEALLAVLTPKRYALMKAVKKNGRFESIEALADELRRDRSTVSRDLRALADAGLILLHEAVHPGHGRRAEIAPVARKLRVELFL